MKEQNKEKMDLNMRKSKRAPEKWEKSVIQKNVQFPKIVSAVR